jgi:hypothetical protein
MLNISSLSLVRNTDPEIEQRPTESELRERLSRQAQELSSFAQDPRPSGGKELTFKAFEEALIPMVFALARTAVTLFLACAERREEKRIPSRLERGGRVFRPAPAQARNLETWFGVVRYFRTYMREVGEGAHRGFYPLDLTLGLTADRVSMTLLSVAVRLATKLSFSEARSVLQWFLPTVPSTELIEQAALGLGRHTAEWFESGAPAFENEGEVLVVMIDSKGIPTATDSELKKRRRPHRKAGRAISPRHRGRQQRRRRGRRPRRAKGDKSKNAKMATVVVMYTLKRQGPYLLGPINRWIYASFAPKKHAFAIAKREANKRGFGPDSGKVVQLVTDGDPDLGCYARQYFADAIHTVDIMHVFEKLWSAGECIHREGSPELQKWFDRQRDLLYEGKTRRVLLELHRHLDATPKKGPGNKGKRQRLEGAIRYIEKRIDQMKYDELIAQDLEVSSGPVEGAVKYIVGRRCDHGGMRWIKERSEAILQLRCIEINGNWDDFIGYVHDRIQRSARETAERVRIQQKQAAPLPDFVTSQKVVAPARGRGVGGRQAS